MIVPRTPLPLPLEDRPEEDLTPEEMTQLVRQLKVWILHSKLNQCSSLTMVQAKVANTTAIKREREDDNDNNPRANKKARSSADPVHLELNDDDTFTEVAVAPREKTIIALDD